MSCFEREQLFGYASRLLEEKELAEVRTHLEACAQCREVVDGYQRMDAVLDEWKAAEPGAWFDVRVRQAVSAQPTRSTAGEFWNLGWTGGVAIATLGILVVSGAIWFARRSHVVSNHSALVARPSNPPAAKPAAPEVAKVNPALVAPARPERPPKDTTVVKSVDPTMLDDEDAVTVNDDELLANFDVLSELPRTEAQVAN